MSGLQIRTLVHESNIPPSSTVFACVRASSLGLAVSDLSWVYCWAAIWGNIELGFGILGAVRSSSSFATPPLNTKLTVTQTEPRPLPHLLRLLQTRPRQPHLPHPLLRLPPLPSLPRRLQQPLKLPRPALPPKLQKVQIQQKPHQQPPLISNPNPQLRPLPNLGWLTRQQILARANPSWEEE